MLSKAGFSCGVGGIVVSIAAFQAVDAGSIPDRRTILFLLNLFRETSRTAVQIILRFLTFGLCILFFFYFFRFKTVLFFLCEIKV